MDLNKRYARVENGEIKEPYVAGLHIKNRGHDPILYHEVIFEKEPAVGKFQYLREVLRVEGRTVIASYVVENKDANQILMELHQSRVVSGSPEAMNEFGMPKQPDIIISTVDEDIVVRVLELVKKYASDRLDRFAQERDYDSIVSLTTYATSNIPKFKNEGQRGVDLRDETFAALHGYLAQLMTGEAFVPKSLADVEALLPVLTWEAAPAN